VTVLAWLARRLRGLPVLCMEASGSRPRDILPLPVIAGVCWDGASSGDGAEGFVLTFAVCLLQCTQFAMGANMVATRVGWNHVWPWLSPFIAEDSVFLLRDIDSKRRSNGVA